MYLQTWQSLITLQLLSMQFLEDMKTDANIENSIFRSIHAVALDTMPGYKSEGVEHSFLERFHAQEEAFNEE